MDEQQPSRLIRPGTDPAPAITVDVAPSWHDRYQQMLRDLAASFGISFAQLSADYEAMHGPVEAATQASIRMSAVLRSLRRGALVKAERLCDEAGFRTAIGHRGMGRKMKRARRLFEQCYGPAYSRDTAQDRFRRAYMRGMTAQRIQRGRYMLMAAGWAKLKAMGLEPEGWKGPGRGYVDPVIVDPPWGFSR